MSKESRFLKACSGESVDCTPVWFMRQAGRYMKEYQALRKKHSMLELCRNPELAAEVTLQPIRRFPIDAAIIFADILLPLPVIGVPFDFSKGEGPKIFNPIRTPMDVENLHSGEPERELSYVCDAIRLVRTQLSKETALIGFAGAPFTLASYMIEGGYSRNFLETKKFMYHYPDSWKLLMGILVEVASRYLIAQVEAGAQVVQLFDSWVGTLSPEDYKSFVLPYSRAIFRSITPLDVPMIHFGTGTAGFLELMRDAGGSVMGIDWRIPLNTAWERIGFNVPVQGNLDPLAMMAPKEILKTKVDSVMQKAAGRPGHIFNLGHGFLPQTSVENVETVVDWVHGFKG